MRKRLLAISGLMSFSLLLTGCSNLSNLSNTQTAIDNFPLAISNMPESEGRWGTYCEQIWGQGWSCIVEVKVENPSKAPWDGMLTANLIAEDGAVNASSDSQDNSTLTGTFMNSVNPGKIWDWAIFFEVGENIRFTSVDIVDSSGSTVSTLPVCIGSSDADSQGC